MTDTTPVTTSVQPTSIEISSPGEYQVATLTLTITNVQPSSSYDLSGGLTITLPLDTATSETESGTALVLSTASLGEQVPLAAVTDVVPNVLAGTEWSIVEVSQYSCVYNAQPNPDNNGMLAPGASLQFTFSNVVTDFVPGSASITISALPATSTGTAVALPSVAITKLPAPFGAWLKAVPLEVNMPFTTTNLTWQSSDASSCALTWIPATTVVTYNNASYSDGALPDTPLEVDAGAPVVATVYQDTTFTLTANGPDGAEDTYTQGVIIATPRFAALTMPPVVNGTAPVGGGTPGTPMVTGVLQDGAGDPAGGQPVTITGTGFTGATSVAFGSAPVGAGQFQVVTDSTITATAPPIATSDVDNSTLGTVVNVTVTVGGGTSPVTSAVTSADQYTYANQATQVAVSPYQQVELIWSCFDNTFPVLSWSGPSGTTVTVTGPGYIREISNPGSLGTSGSATATIAGPTTFSIAVDAGPVPPPVKVLVGALSLTAFSAGSVSVDPLTGVQSVTLNWTAQNATSFALTGGGLSVSLPYDQSSYLVANLPTNGPTTYYLAANGFDAGGNPISTQQSVPVTPVAVQLTSFAANPTSIPQGGSSTLTWAATAATGYTVQPGGYYGPDTTQLPVTPSYTTQYTLTADGYSPNGPQSLTAKVTVQFHKEPDKLPQKEKNILPEISQAVTTPGTVPGPGDLADPDPAPSGGTAQAFIDPDERPSTDAPGVQGSTPATGEA